MYSVTKQLGDSEPHFGGTVQIKDPRFSIHMASYAMSIEIIPKWSFNF